MKTLTIIVLLLLPRMLCAQSPVTADASLESVTVYTRGVEMNHKARVDLPAGSSEIIITNVAKVLDESSVRIGANANVTVMSVSFNRDYQKPKEKSRAYLRIQDSLKILNGRLAALSNEQQAEESVLQVLERNGTIAGTNTSVSVAELEKMVEYYGRKQLEVKKKITALVNKENECAAEIALLQQQLAELTADHADNKGQLVVQVVAKAAANADFTISYVSPNAAWNAFYDLRAESTSQPLGLSYKANITQSTGIDWKKVKLLLATGSPSRNNTAPALTTWFLRFNSFSWTIDRKSFTGSLATLTSKDIARRPVADIKQALEDSAEGLTISNGGGQPGAMQDISVRGSNAAVESPMIVMDGAPYEGSLSSIDPGDIASTRFLKDAEATNLYGSRAQRGVIEVKTQSRNLSNYTTARDRELNATFQVDLPYDIASNAKPHSVSLKEYKVPATYRYYATRKSSTEAFLTAEISGYDQLNLLPGMANIIFESMYIGKSMLDPAITTDTMNLSLGTDSRIVIQREKVVESSGIKMIGSNRRQTYTYEIKVRNGKKETVNLVLKDQYPIATDKDMEIELLEASAAEDNKETGILIWDLKMAPGETKTLRLSYSIKYPRAKLIANL